jgi:hypothetical protein
MSPSDREVNRGVPVPKVFVTQEVTTANYSDIERFGEPVFLSASEVSNVPDSLHNQKLVGLIRERFHEYDPGVDFIAPSGSPIIAGLVFALAREKGDTFNVLKWNNRDRVYTAIRIGVKGVTGVY